MGSAYEELKAGMRELAVIQERQFWEDTIHGTRHILPLEGREIPVVIYGQEPDAPVLFCCYGGGFIMGSAVNDDACWDEVQRKLGVTLVSIAYRKAPEHPFPYALYDVYDSIAYMESHLAEFGIHSQDWSVYGFSAGGNLAAAVCLLDAQRGGRLGLKRQILNYPYLDLATSPKAKGHPEDERLIYTLFPEYYCGGQDPCNPLISPVYAEEGMLKNLPRAIVSLGESDPLHAEGARYICKLRAAGIQVDCITAADMPHGYVEIAFQQPGPYLAPKATEQLLNGQIEIEKNKTIDFVKEHF